MMSPCFTCTRVRDPKNCENKLCKDWQSWFINRWDTMRKALCAEVAQAPVCEIGVPLGGNRYASPHRVRDFLNVSPCRNCIYPTDECHMPCKTKLAWSEMQSEVRR